MPFFLKVGSATIFMFALLGLEEGQAHTTICGPRADILKKLAEKYKEVPVAFGTVGDDNGSNLLLELLSSEKGETWTLTMTSPDGKTCLVSSGKNWRHRRDPVFPTDPSEKT